MTLNILFNAKIRTMNERQPFASALAFENGRIVAVGTDDEVLNLATAGSLVQNMDDRVIWPGLTDSHLHFELYANSLSDVDCETTTKEECLNRVAARAAFSRPGEWIRGYGFNQNIWADGFGTAADLDRVAPNNPVFITQKSVHAAWVNSAALKIAGINPATPDPEGGIIDRDLQGNPTGILFESAYPLVEKIIPEHNDEELLRIFKNAQSSLWKFGLTGVHDFDRRQCFKGLQQLQEQGELKLRVVKSIPLEDLPSAVGLGLRTGFGSDFLRIGSVKLFADGALGPQSAAMFQPYENSQQTGMLLLDSEDVYDYGQQAAMSGLSLAIHAIGDLAVHEVLNGFEMLRSYEQEHHLPHLRHRIEHVQLLHPQDVTRLADLDLIASMQPLHATSDMYIADRFWGERSRLAYALNTVIEMKTHTTFGSDSPVETPNPFQGIHAAVTRRRPDGSPGPEGWYPEQRLDLQTALAGFTLGPAFAAGLENRLGQLAPGYWADLIVLAQDPNLLPISDLYSVKPDATLVAGEWVWRSQ